MVNVLWWFVVVEGLRLAVLPLVWRLFSNLPSRGIAYARPFGLLLVGIIVWLFPALHILPYTYLLVLTVTVVVAGIIWIVWGRLLIGGLRTGLPHSLPALILPEVVFLAAVIWQIFMVTLYPNIYISEKPMNFAFVNAINRSAFFPPSDPWLSGYTINYYYFGHFLVSLLMRLSGVTHSVGFTLAGVAFFGMVAASIFSLVWDVIVLHTMAIYHNVSFRVLMVSGLGAVFLTLFVGNLTPVYQFVTSPQIVFTWWARGEPSWWTMPYHSHGQLSELPWRTYLMQYLHSFDMAVPFLLLAFAWGTRYIWYQHAGISRETTELFFWITLVVVLAGAILTSPWVMPVIAMLIGLLVLCDLVALIRHNDKNSLVVFRNFIPLIIRWSGVCAGVFLLTRPFSQHYQPVGALWQLASGLAQGMPVGAFLLQFGVQLGVLSTVLVACRVFQRRIWPSIVCLGIITMLLIGVLTSWIGLPVAIFIFFWCCILWLNVQYYWQHGHVSFPYMMLLVAQTLNTLPFFLVIHDSGNTFFKFGFLAWIINGVGSFAAIGAVWGQGFLKPRFARRIAILVLSTLLFVGAWMPALATWTSTNRLQGFDIRTLDGVSFYLNQVYPEEYDAIIWLTENAEPTDVVLEATGPVYTPAARVSAFTGIPTVLGWFNHQMLWRERDLHVLYDIQQRLSDVNRIYATLDHSEAQCLLQKYNVSYVFVGGVERGIVKREGQLELHWPPEALKKFAQFMDVVYSTPNQGPESSVIIYRRRSTVKEGCPAQ
jgi:YYY domain-containing protein